MVAAGMAGAGGILAFSQLSGSSLDELIGEEMGLSQPMLDTAAKVANNALGAGGDVSFTVLAVAAMPVVFHVVKSGLSMLKEEHELSIAKRRQRAGLDRSGAPE